MPSVCGGQQRGMSTPRRGSPQPVFPGGTQLGTIVCSLHSQHCRRGPWGGERGVSADEKVEDCQRPMLNSYHSTHLIYLKYMISCFIQISTELYRNTTACQHVTVLVLRFIPSVPKAKLRHQSANQTVQFDCSRLSSIYAGPEIGKSCLMRRDRASETAEAQG